MMARAAAVLLLATVGCSQMTSPARRHQLEWGEPYWFDYSAERRGAVLMPFRGKTAWSVRFCAEPAPDIALRQAVELVGKAQTPQGVTAEASAKFSADIVQLAGRTQTILFLREALYRLCEQSLNGNLRPEEIAPLFAEVLRSSTSMSQAQLVSEINKTTVSKISAVEEAVKSAPAIVLPPPDQNANPAPGAPQP